MDDTAPDAAPGRSVLTPPHRGLHAHPGDVVARVGRGRGHYVLEISRVRKDMYVESLSGGAGGGAGGGGRPELPEPEGAVVTLQQKLYIPTKEYPDTASNCALAAFTNLSATLGPDRGSFCSEQTRRDTGGGSQRLFMKAQGRRGPCQGRHRHLAGCPAAGSPP
ncbi:unnamed protein product [Lampetra planeri]